MSPPSLLMSLPEEVLQDFIFAFLNYEDLLRLRRVSKPVKTLSDQVLRKDFKLKCIAREINETNLTFQNYLRVNLPTTSIHLNNHSSSIFQDPAIPEFLRLHGNHIIHLEVELFTCCISEQEFHFYSSLPNLMSVEIQQIDVSQESSRFPPTFKNLKNLKLKYIQGSSKMVCQDYAGELIQFCENLEYLKSSYTAIFQILAYIRRRHEKYPNLPNLRFYDMENFLGEAEGDINQIEKPWLSDWFGSLALQCSYHDIKLLNVHSDILKVALNSLEEPDTQETSTLVSIRNVSCSMFDVGLPCLEKLTIESTYWSGFCDFSGRRNWIAPTWPKLKQVDLTLDGKIGGHLEEFASMNLTTALLNFIFNTQRESKEFRGLAIRYAKDNPNLKSLDEELRYFPWARKLTRTCPLLTKLTLENWKGLDKVVVKLLEGFPLLEELVLKACEQLGDSAFVDGQQTFFSLKKLKKLSLMDLHLMPKITDLAFQTVFRNLKIECFILTSEQPLKSITAAGIESLVDGDFNSSVEKFPFSGWSLDGVSPEAFNKLKLKFRASCML